MANILDMVFGPGTGAITPYVPTPTAAPANPYQPVVDRFSGGSGQYMPMGYQTPGSTAAGRPDLTMPQMGQSTSTPTYWPYDYQSAYNLQGMPTMPMPSWPGSTAGSYPSAQTRGVANARLTPEQTALAAIEEASPRANLRGGLGPVMAMSLPRASLIADNGFFQPEDDPWADMLTPGETSRRKPAAKKEQQKAKSLFDMLFGGGSPAPSPGLGGMLAGLMGGGGTPITAPGGGGAFVNSNPAPNTPLSNFDTNALLPASMNNSRWTTGY